MGMGGALSGSHGPLALAAWLVLLRRASFHEGLVSVSAPPDEPPANANAGSAAGSAGGVGGDVGLGGSVGAEAAKSADGSGGPGEGGDTAPSDAATGGASFGAPPPALAPAPAARALCVTSGPLASRLACPVFAAAHTLPSSSSSSAASSSSPAGSPSLGLSSPKLAALLPLLGRLSPQSVAVVTEGRDELRAVSLFLQQAGVEHVTLGSGAGAGAGAGAVCGADDPLSWLGAQADSYALRLGSATPNNTSSSNRTSSNSNSSSSRSSSSNTSSSGGGAKEGPGRGRVPAGRVVLCLTSAFAAPCLVPTVSAVVVLSEGGAAPVDFGAFFCVFLLCFILSLLSFSLSFISIFHYHFFAQYTSH